jgi:hypothetical protein
LRTRRTCSALGLRHGSDDLADLHVIAVTVGDALEHAGPGRGHFDVDLVGLELDERLAGSDRIAFLFQPPRDPRIHDGLADLGHDDVDRHMEESTICNLESAI